MGSFLGYMEPNGGESEIPESTLVQYLEVYRQDSGQVPIWDQLSRKTTFSTDKFYATAMSLGFY
jgi:hypothetical protein